MIPSTAALNKHAATATAKDDNIKMPSYRRAAGNVAKAFTVKQWKKSLSRSRLSNNHQYSMLVPLSNNSLTAASSFGSTNNKDNDSSNNKLQRRRPLPLNTEIAIISDQAIRPTFDRAVRSVKRDSEESHVSHQNALQSEGGDCSVEYYLSLTTNARRNYEEDDNHDDDGSMQDDDSDDSFYLENDEAKKFFGGILPTYEKQECDGLSYLWGTNETQNNGDYYSPASSNDSVHTEDLFDPVERFFVVREVSIPPVNHQLQEHSDFGGRKAASTGRARSKGWTKPRFMKQLGRWLRRLTAKKSFDDGISAVTCRFDRCSEF